MNTRINKIIAGALVIALGPVVANADPTEGPNGNLYEVIVGPAVSWDAAKSAAEGMTHDDTPGGVPGHLATITSAAEDAYVDGLREAALGAGAGVAFQAWIGGSQPSTSADPDDWTWVNDEGAIPGVDSESPYADWAGGEPNGSSAENYLTSGRFGTSGGWNDEDGPFPAYAVEYDVASRFVPPGPGGLLSGGANTGILAKYTNVLVGGNASINCCKVHDWREHSGSGGKHKDYMAVDFDLGDAILNIQTNPTCVDMPLVATGRALLRPWQRGVPEFKESHDTVDDHQIGVCHIQSPTVSQGVIFSAEDTVPVLGYAMDCNEPQIDYRPFTGAVALDPTEGNLLDRSYVVRISADCNRSRSAKKGSTNLVAMNLWHYQKSINSKPYLVGLYDALLELIEDERTRSCVDNNEGFVDNMESYVQAAKVFTGKKGPGPQKAVDALNDATRLAMLINMGPRPIPLPTTNPNPYLPACEADNVQGLWIGRVMAIKFGVCSELQHKLTNSSSSVDNNECVIEPDIFAELPEL